MKALDLDKLPMDLTVEILIMDSNFLCGYEPWNLPLIMFFVYLIYEMFLVLVCSLTDLTFL